MAELNKFDVQQAVKDGLRDVTNSLATIKDNVARIEVRTNDLDQSQAEIKQIVRLAPQLEESIHKLRDIHSDAEKINQVINDVATLKALLQSNIQYLQQVSEYLAAMDARAREDEGFRKA